MGEGARKTQKQAKQPADVEALVKAALAKERWAVEEIVDLVRPMVAMFSRRLIPDFSVADDLLQEVMVSLFTSLPGFDFDRDFTGWLRLVCRNKTIDMARKLDRLDEVLIDPDQLPDPRSIEQTRQGSELASALRRLPRDWGRVIALHHYAGLTFAEIGRLTGTPEKTWYSRYRRGTELLKELLAALSAVAAALALTLSPAGGTVAEWFKGVVGIGEPGGPPSWDTSRQPRHRDAAVRQALATDLGRASAVRSGAGDHSVVIGKARIAGLPIEVVSSRMKRGNRCLSVDLPHFKGGVTGCLPEGKSPGAVLPPSRMVVDGKGNVPVAERSLLMLIGRSPAETKEVVVHGRGRSGRRRTWRAKVIDPSAAIRATAGLPASETYFVAVLGRPPARALFLSALDRQGRTIARTRTALDDGGPIQMASSPKR